MDVNTVNPVKNNHKAALNGEGDRLEDLFHQELKDIYWAEKKMVKVLSKLKKAACSDALQQAFEDHVQLTKQHVNRLENVFELMDYSLKSKKCEGMTGLTKEGEHMIRETKEDTATRDVALILTAQKMEHYEIATYGTLVQLAKILGHDQVADLLSATLQEEKETDRKLTAIAENCVNAPASLEPEEA